MTRPVGCRRSATSRCCHDRSALPWAPGRSRPRRHRVGGIFRGDRQLTATTGVGRPQWRPACFCVRSGASLASSYAATLPDQRTTHHNAGVTSGEVLRQEEPRQYFAMASASHSSYGTWDGYAVLSVSQHNSSYSGGMSGFGRLGARGADRPVLCERGRGASQPGRRRRSKLRRHPCGDIERNGTPRYREIAGRAWRRGHLLHFVFTDLYLHPNTFNDVDGRYIEIRRCHPQRCRSGHPHANFSDWDTYRSLTHCRDCCSRNGPAT